MKFYLTSNRINTILLILLVLLGIGSFAYNQYLVDHILKQERSSVKLWAKATEFVGNPVHDETSRNLLYVSRQLKNNPTVSNHLIELIKQAETDHAQQNFVVKEIILKDRYHVPTLIVDQKGHILTEHHLNRKPNHQLVKKFAAMNPPIEIKLGNSKHPEKQYVYYGESKTVRYLQYFPYVQLSLLTIVLGIAFISFRSISKSEQSNIWVGMTKEAAHQLGTPLSSLYGWVELLREETNDDFTQRICKELKNDITRLKGIAERFNKIGSKPELEPANIAPLLDEIIDYMERRLPQLGQNVEIRRDIEPNIQARVNPELFKWALENLMKNAMDAIKPSLEDAHLSIKAHRIENELVIDVKDSGSGIEKKFHHEIFRPGYSTKKRGWGLGLSLTKRIIENYHQGKLFVAHSQSGKGTTMRIILQADLS